MNWDKFADLGDHAVLAVCVLVLLAMGFGWLQ